MIIEIKEVAKNGGVLNINIMEADRLYINVDTKEFEFFRSDEASYFCLNSDNSSYIRSYLGDDVDKVVITLLDHDKQYTLQK